MFPIKEERDLNSNQNNNRGKGGGNKRNMTAIVSILLWALVLTLLVNLATSRLQQANCWSTWPRPGYSRPIPWRCPTASSAS